MWNKFSLLSLVLASCMIYACNNADSNTASKDKEHQHDGEHKHDHDGHDHAGHDHSGHDHSGHDHSGHDHKGTTSNHFGEKINADNAISYDNLLDKMEKIDSLDAKVTGKVTEVCQKKGCWISIASDTKGKQEMFVKFKDYGFFMPKDISGRKVVMDGYAFKTTTSVEELQHYAEDAGKSKEEIAAITEPEEELQFLASGVILLEED